MHCTALQCIIFLGGCCLHVTCWAGLGWARLAIIDVSADMDNSTEDPTGALFGTAPRSPTSAAVNRGRTAQTSPRPVPRPRQRSPAKRSVSENCESTSGTEAPRLRTSASADWHNRSPVEANLLSEVPAERVQASQHSDNYVADLLHKVEDLQTEIAFVRAQVSILT